jgi:hypothetical protein
MAEEAYVNAVQTITVTGAPTGGSFKLTYDGAQTAAIAWNATAAVVQAALEALPNIGTGGVVGAGGPLPGTPVTITFSGPNVAKRSVPLMVADSTGFTGGASPTATPTMSTPGTGYGDYVAPSRFLEFVSENLNLESQRIESASMRASNRVLRSDRRIVNKKGAKGSLELEVASKGFGMPFKYMLPTVVITTPAGGSLTRRQRFTIGDPWNKSLSVQVGRPDLGGTVRAFSYKGVKIESWELSNDIDGILKLALNVDAKDEDLAQSLGAASYASAFELLNYTGGQLTIGGANVDIRSFKLSGTPAAEDGPVLHPLLDAEEGAGRERARRPERRHRLRLRRPRPLQPLRQRRDRRGDDDLDGLADRGDGPELLQPGRPDAAGGAVRRRHPERQRLRRGRSAAEVQRAERRRQRADHARLLHHRHRGLAASGPSSPWQTLAARPSRFAGSTSSCAPSVG